MCSISHSEREVRLQLLQIDCFHEEPPLSVLFGNGAIEAACNIGAQDRLRRFRVELRSTKLGLGAGEINHARAGIE